MDNPSVVVICTRDPDASNEYALFERNADGRYIRTDRITESVLIHDIDCGRADLTHPDEFDEWAFHHLLAARSMPEAAANYVEATVEQYAEFHEGWQRPTDDEITAGERKEEP